MVWVVDSSGDGTQPLVLARQVLLHGAPPQAWPWSRVTGVTEMRGRARRMLEIGAGRVPAAECVLTMRQHHRSNNRVLSLVLLLH